MKKKKIQNKIHNTFTPVYVEFSILQMALEIS